MNRTSPPVEQLTRAFRPNERGIVGVVDELLALCVAVAGEVESLPTSRREKLLELGWNDGTCSVRLVGVASPEAGPITGEEPTSTTPALFQAPLSMSMFRAMLARFAALCNEHTADSVSPYGGEGEILPHSNSKARLRVAFKNTQREQWLEVRRVGEHPASAPATSQAPVGVADSAAVTSPDPA